MSRALILAALWRSTTALLVAEGSPCGVRCGNVLDSTARDMIVCEESAYRSTSVGQVYESCVSCEATSTYSTESRRVASDLQSFLYNLRYTTNVCLFEESTNPCITLFACENIQQAVRYGNLSTNSATYGYCDLWSEYNLDKCHDCLKYAPNGHYLSNFISILDGACKMRPEPPVTIHFEGNLFSTDIVNVTEPTPTATYEPPGLTGPLDSGAIAGIAIGGFVVLLAIVGCGIVINGKRRRKAYLRRREQAAKNWPPSQGGGEMFETPISQRPLRGWEDSPVSAATQATFPPYFSPYVSQYNSPVSGGEGQGSMWPVEKSHNIGVAISPDREAPSPWDDKKGKDKMTADTEGYELQEGVNSAGGYGFPIPPPPPIPDQAPTLGHPGYGRHGTASQP
ncbi:hypothetical protein GGS23DRAFT_436615 [Durotheca rogersii]|uniref:uncharacterized protein n=1 Tax=Durotheca rogersii TaxID=419775 RepID=UPI00221FB0B4|nr:uncharacterized protein GGS23DRAFT_436615 [Durotheca rogersii]KAI5865646.1 hypothetical protein GGS23DRAFT_436615 [Durotheca rogersii]